MRTLRFLVFVVLAALLGVACADHRGAESKSQEAEGERESGLARQERIAQAVAEIEQLHKQRLFSIRFLDALYRAKPDRAWFTCLQSLAGPGGKRKILLEGYVEYPSLRTPIPPEHAVTEEEAVASVVQCLADRVDYLKNIHSGHTDASVGTAQARARFWLMADLVKPAPARPSPFSPLAERIRVLVDQIKQPDLPESFTRNDVATDPHEFNLVEGEAQCSYCGWIMPENATHCPRCEPAPRDPDKDGMPDDWEDRYESTDSLKPDADEDPDGDGFLNIREFLGGSSPDDPDSVPRPLAALRVYASKTEARFVGYMVEAGGDLDVIDPQFWLVTLQFGRGSRTDIVRLGQAWKGHTVGPLTKRTARRTDHGDYLVDEYTVTLERKGEQPIRLVKGMWMTLDEQTYVDLVITRGRDAGKTYTCKTVGDTMLANGEEYEVTTIAGSTVKIKDSEGREYNVSP